MLGLRSPKGLYILTIDGAQKAPKQPVYPHTNCPISIQLNIIFRRLRSRIVPTGNGDKADFLGSSKVEKVSFTYTIDRAGRSPSHHASICCKTPYILHIVVMIITALPLTTDFAASSMLPCYQRLWSSM
jgi:hypothetical protein